MSDPIAGWTSRDTRHHAAYRKGNPAPLLSPKGQGKARRAEWN